MPKVHSIAAKEHPDVLFVKVAVTSEDGEAAQLAQAMSVDRFPSFHFFSGAAGLVASMTATLNAESLANLRAALRFYSTPQVPLVAGQQGPAAVLDAPGWPRVA